jgi:hypothetical protein
MPAAFRSAAFAAISYRNAIIAHRQPNLRKSLAMREILTSDMGRVANRPIVRAVAMAVSTPSMAASPPYDGNMKLFSFADFRPRDRRMC